MTDVANRVQSIRERLITKEWHRISSAHRVLLGMGALLSASGLFAEEIELSSPVAISADVMDSQEPSSMLCAHPREVDQLIAGTTEGKMNSSSYPGNVDRDHLHIFSSLNNGGTWKSRFRSNDIHWYVDPACTYAEDGAIVVSSMMFNLESVGKFLPRGYHLRRSEDGGQTWQSTKIDYDQFLDRGFLTTDHVSPRFRGRMYLSALGASGGDYSVQKPFGMVLFRSDDGGRSFTGPATVDAGLGAGVVPDKGILHPGPPVTLRDGTIILSWYAMYSRVGTMQDWEEKRDRAALRHDGQERGASKMMIARSLDGGITFESPITVATGIWTTKPDNYAGQDGSPGKFVPALAADTSSGPFRNHVYAAWADLRNGSKQVWFSASEDGGKTWQPARVISDEVVEHSNSSQVSIAVNKNGVIAAFFYTETNPSLGHSAILVTSSDGGLTWSPAIQVLPFTLSSVRAGYRTNVVRRIEVGDGLLYVERSLPPRSPTCTALVTADADGAFHMLVLGNPGAEYVVYHVRARLNAVAQQRRELREDVTVSLTPFEYDPSRRIYRTRATVTNTSRSNISLPITLVPWTLPDVYAKSLLSKGGARPIFVNSDNGRKDLGAYWNLHGLSHVSMLRPNETTVPRVLELQLDEPPVPPEGIRRASFSFTMRIFAPNVLSGAEARSATREGMPPSSGSAEVIGSGPIAQPQLRAEGE